MTPTVKERELGLERMELRKWVAIQEMDRAKTVAEDVVRIHDDLAQELGFERVRIHHIQPGDVLVGYSLNEVDEIAVCVDPAGFEHYEATYTDGGYEHFDAGQFVSRQLPLPENEPF